jgi:peptide/nickel transport system permease protein
MRPSTLASGTAEVAEPVAERRLLVSRVRSLLRVLRTPTGLIGAGLTSVVVLAATFADAIAPYDPFATVAPALQPPSTSHWMGTDDLGRDILSGVLHGARTSMLVAVAVLAIASAIGTAVGVTSGYLGGVVDDALMRLTELVQAVPRFFLAILVVAFFGVGLENVVVVLGLTSWPLLARVIRAEVLTIRELEFVAAARSIGSTGARIVLRHVLPNALPPAVVVGSLLASSVILIEAGLGFLGLGDPDAMSWGYLANNAQAFLRVAWWTAVFPGLAISLSILGINLLSDALSDTLNPLRTTSPRVGTQDAKSQAMVG